MGTRQFLYISDVKVTEVLEQIPETIKPKIAAELGVNLGLLSAKVSVEGSGRAEPTTRIRRCLAAERYLQKKATRDDTHQRPAWLRGNLKGIWGNTLLNLGEASPSEAVVFAGYGAGTALFLSGSSFHRMGDWPKDDRRRMSDLPEILAALAAGESDLGQPGDSLDRAFREALSIAKGNGGGAPGRFGFVTRILFERPIDGHAVIIGSPLFVEQLPAQY
jgi:hypothetical protein